MSEILKRLGVVDLPVGTPVAFTEAGTVYLNERAEPVFVAPGGEPEVLKCEGELTVVMVDSDRLFVSRDYRNPGAQMDVMRDRADRDRKISRGE